MAMSKRERIRFSVELQKIQDRVNEIFGELDQEAGDYVDVPDWLSGAVSELEQAEASAFIRVGLLGGRDMKTTREAYLAGRLLLMIKFVDANGEFFARSQQIKFNEYAVELAKLILDTDAVVEMEKETD